LYSIMVSTGVAVAYRKVHLFTRWCRLLHFNCPTLHLQGKHFAWESVASRMFIPMMNRAHLAPAEHIRTHASIWRALVLQTQVWVINKFITG